jgi:glycosyltransferase involved in cell wall biosynthesis
VRVVLTCDWFLKYASAQAAGLVRAGADVVLLCREHAHEFGGDHAERARSLAVAQEAGVSVLVIPGRLSDPRATPALARLATRIRRWRPHIVHAHDGADPRALALLSGLPTVLTLHDPVLHPGQPLAPTGKRWFLHGSRDAWRVRARAIVVHSQSLRPQVTLRDGQRCVVIAHGLEVSPLPLPAPPQPAIGFFGRLAPYKGLDVLARAMPSVWAARPETRLHVAGSGEEPLALEDPRVEVQRRYLPERDVPGFFAAASLAVLPYTQASQTGVGSLAAGYGVPIVASRLGGLPDLVLDDSYLVPPGDSPALAAALLRHLDDGLDVRGRMLAEIGRPRSWEAVGAQSLALYESVRSAR